MKIQVLFHTSSSPKVVRHVTAVYVKAGLVCVELKPDAKGRVLILKWPVCNIFQIAHHHGKHWGSGK